MISSASCRFPVTKHMAPKTFEPCSSKKDSKPKGSATEPSNHFLGEARNCIVLHEHARG